MEGERRKPNVSSFHEYSVPLGRMKAMCTRRLLHKKAPSQGIRNRRGRLAISLF